MSFKIKSIVRLNRKNYIPLFAAGWFDLLYLLPTHIDSCTASSLQFHLFQPLDHPTSYCYICQFLVLKLPQWSRLCLVSAFICCTLLHKPLPPTLARSLWCSLGHSPNMQESQQPSYISPIPSVAGTLASHLICLVFSQLPFIFASFLFLHGFSLLCSTTFFFISGNKLVFLFFFAIISTHRHSQTSTLSCCFYFHLLFYQMPVPFLFRPLSLFLLF